MFNDWKEKGLIKNENYIMKKYSSKEVYNGKLRIMNMSKQMRILAVFVLIYRACKKK